MAIKIVQDVQKSWHGCSTDRFPLPNSTSKQFHLLDLRGFYPRLRYKCIFPPSPTRLKVLTLGTESNQDGNRENPVYLRRHDVRAEIVNPGEEILPTESILEILDIVLTRAHTSVYVHIIQEDHGGHSADFACQLSQGLSIFRCSLLQHLPSFAALCIRHTNML